jgi:hypothetical protein
LEPAIEMLMGQLDRGQLAQDDHQGTAAVASKDAGLEDVYDEQHAEAVETCATCLARHVAGSREHFRRRSLAGEETHYAGELVRGRGSQEEAVV